MACGKQNEAGNKSDAPCDHGAIQVQIRTCIDGSWFTDWVDLNEIIPPPSLANKSGQGK